MSQPVLGQAKVDKILTQFSQFYSNKVYIAERVLPVLKVKERSGKFAKYGKENLRAYSGQIIRSPGTRAQSIDYSVSQGQYICTEKSLEKGVPDEFVENSDDPYDPKRDATSVIMDNIFINQEYALAAYLNNTANLTLNTTLSGSSKWSAYATSNPITDINTAIQTVRAATGQRPNVMVIGLYDFMVLKYHPDIRAQVRYTNGGQLSDADLGNFLKAFFNLEEVIVGEAVMNTALPGQTDSISDIWTGFCVLMYRTPRPTLMQATFGLTLSDVPRMVQTYREESNVQDVIRVRYSYDQNIFDANLGYLIKGTT